VVPNTPAGRDNAVNARNARDINRPVFIFILLSLTILPAKSGDDGLYVHL